MGVGGCCCCNNYCTAAASAAAALTALIATAVLTTAIALAAAAHIGLPSFALTGLAPLVALSLLLLAIHCLPSVHHPPSIYWSPITVHAFLPCVSCLHADLSAAAAHHHLHHLWCLCSCPTHHLLIAIAAAIVAAVASVTPTAAATCCHLHPSAVFGLPTHHLTSIVHHPLLFVVHVRLPALILMLHQCSPAPGLYLYLINC